MTAYTDRQEYAKRSISNYLNAIRNDTAFKSVTVKRGCGTFFKERVLLTRLKSARETKGLTQRKLATMSDVSEECLMKYEQGRAKVGTETADKLARALKCKVEDLI